MLCADLVDIEWRDTGGRDRKTVANLEDISLEGACLQLDDPIPLHATVRISHGRGELQGRIRYCVYRDIGYFLGVQFDPDSRWSRKDFRPQHLFDPRRLTDPAERNGDSGVAPAV
jgi:hypothetical protein